MALVKTVRLAINTWTAGTDPFRRGQRNDDAAALEAVVARFGAGTLAARPAPAAANVGTYYTVTDPVGTGGRLGALYYSTGTAWVEVTPSLDLPLGIVGYAATTTNQGGITTAHIAVTLSVPVVANRRYKITAAALVGSTVAGDDCAVHVRLNDVTLAGQGALNTIRYAETTALIAVNRHATFTASVTGNVTVNTVVTRVLGTGTLTVAPASSLTVEDVGRQV